jgi:bifunctional UDP-N-acetylglucosamine pyrophosphorylase/glucosamine-1-phosphate N-acetyltransferase
MDDISAVILAAGKGTRMRSELPKVLHQVDGVPMIVHSVQRARAAGITNITIVVGYGGDLIRDELAGQGVLFVDQPHQLGTGHAVAQAKELLENAPGPVVVLYGDMPLLSPPTIAALVDTMRRTDAAGVALTVELDAPPDFGRIIRDADGRVIRVVEVKDATPEELAVREVNVGAYCFDPALLLDALGRLRADNQQAEYYLTDVIGILASDGRRVETLVTDALEEALGVNDPLHLAFAGKLSDIEYAESLYDLIDAAAAMRRTSP